MSVTSVLKIQIRSAAKSPPSPLVGTLADRAFDGKLDLYLGAGVSSGPPTGLLLADALFNRVKDAVANEFADQIDQSNPPQSLQELGSAVIQGDPQRRARFNLILLESDGFTIEEPNDEHRTLALLILLGLATVMSANWDDCVERAAWEMGGKISPTVTDEDRRKGNWHLQFHKVHGCANDGDSLLVSAEDLSDPPDWVRQSVGADIGPETLVFLGLGTVSDYVGTRIKQLFKEPTKADLDIHVVIPDEELPDSWKDTLGVNAETRHIRATAAEFLDEFLRAVWHHAITSVHIERGKVAEDMKPDDAMNLKLQLDRLIDELQRVDAMCLLQWWTNGVDLKRKPGMLQSSEARIQLLAVASLAQATVEVRQHEEGAAVCLEHCYMELALADGGRGTDLERRQRSRITRRAARGAYAKRDRPILVLHDGTGTPVPSHTRDMIAGQHIDPQDLVEGAEGPTVIYRRTSDILHRQLLLKELLAA